MTWFDIHGDQPLSPSCLLDGNDGHVGRYAVAALRCAAGPKGAPPTIPPIIITPFRYQVPGPAIDPRTPPPSPPIEPPSRPALSLSLAAGG